VDIPVEEGSKETVQMKVWARRVWTLELSLVSNGGRLRGRKEYVAEDICTTQL